MASPGRTAIAVMLVAAALAGAACSKKASEGGAAADPRATRFVPLKASTKRTDLLYTYLGPDGRFVTVDSADKVPENARKQVTVTDLSLSPEERQSDRIIY